MVSDSQSLLDRSSGNGRLATIWRVRFVMTGGEIRLISPRQLTMAVWANNHGGDTGDSVAYVRPPRSEDQQARQAREDRVAEAVGVSADQDPDEVAERVLAELGI